MRHSRLSAVVVLGVLVILITATRVHVWSNQRLVWLEAVSVSPAKPRPWVNLGNVYAAEGLTSLAAVMYETAVTRSEAPGRALDEQQEALAIAEANLALMRWIQGRENAALHLIDVAYGRAPYSKQIAEVYAWMRGPSGS